jgi:hypothetical protein
MLKKKLARHAGLVFCIVLRRPTIRLAECRSTLPFHDLVANGCETRHEAPV